MTKKLLLIDTSIMLEILEVPQKSNGPKIKKRFNAMLTSDDYILILPMATILETGNHISHIKSHDNDLRFIIANEFIKKVKMAIDGTTPFKALRWETEEIGTLIDSLSEIRDWIDSFPDYAKREISFGDCSIIEQFKKLCYKFSAFPIKVWSKDDDLKYQDQNWNDSNWQDI